MLSFYFSWAQNDDGSRRALKPQSSSFLLLTLEGDTHISLPQGTSTALSLADSLPFCAFQGRRCLRPRLHAHKFTGALYDFGSWLGTRVCIAYLQVPFVLLDISTSLRVYRLV